MQQLGMILNNYGSQNFPLEHSDTEFPAVIDKFQRTVTEVGLSWDLTCFYDVFYLFFLYLLESLSTKLLSERFMRGIFNVMHAVQF